MAKITFTPELRKFLADRRLLKKATENTEAYQKAEKFERNEITHLTSAFVWADTPQGHEFWQNISNERYKEQRYV